LKKTSGTPSPHLHLQMLGAVLEFMHRVGMDEPAIRDSVQRSLAGLTSRLSSRDVGRLGSIEIGNENLSAELLRVWHRDGRYIDMDAKPRPLSLTKGRNNLRATIRRLDPTANAAEILREMKLVKLIRRTSNGKYLPTSEAAIVTTMHPLATDHIAKLVIRLVSTVSRNIDSTAKSLPLIERHAYAPDLNIAEREAFAEFTRAQGMAYLESVDNWLEKRRVRRIGVGARRKPAGVAASVHLFAYLGDEDARVARNSLVQVRNRNNTERKIGRPRLKRPTSDPEVLS
jgi:hypothetical protein